MLPPVTNLSHAMMKPGASTPGTSPYEAASFPLWKAGKVGVPRNDREAMQLVMHTKQANDHHAAKNANAHPAQKAAWLKDRQEHIDAAAQAIHEYHKASPSDFSNRLLDAMHGDPNIKISHPRPK